MFGNPDNRAIRINIYDAAGHIVRNWDAPLDQYYQGGVDWDGKDNDGRFVPNGVYYIHLECGNIKTVHPAAVLKK